MEQEIDSPWLVPEDAAAYLGVALGTLRNWTSARYVPFARRGRVVRYHRDALDRWLAKGSCNGRTTFSDQARLVEHDERGLDEAGVKLE